MDTTQIIPDAWRDLSATQRDILFVLASRGRATATNIRAAFGSDGHPNLVTRQLDGLHDAGYVTSEYADDVSGTGDYHEITDAGLDVIHDAPVRVD